MLDAANEKREKERLEMEFVVYSSFAHPPFPSPSSLGPAILSIVLSVVVSSRTTRRSMATCVSTEASTGPERYMSHKMAGMLNQTLSAVQVKEIGVLYVHVAWCVQNVQICIQNFEEYLFFKKK